MYLQRGPQRAVADALFVWRSQQHQPSISLVDISAMAAGSLQANVRGYNLSNRRNSIETTFFSFREGDRVDGDNDRFHLRVGERSGRGGPRRGRTNINGVGVRLSDRAVVAIAQALPLSVAKLARVKGGEYLAHD